MLDANAKVSISRALMAVANNVQHHPTFAILSVSRKEIDFSKPLLAWMSDCSEWSSKNANYDVQDYTAPASIFEDCPLYTKEQECMIGPASLKEVWHSFEPQDMPSVSPYWLRPKAHLLTG